MMEVATTRFGTLAVAEDQVWTFPQGLVGFEHLKRYVLLDSRKGASLQWLQALEDPSVAFLVCDPKVFLPSVEIRLPEDPAPSGPGAGKAFRKLKILTLLYVDRAEGKLHVNVQAPLLLDPASRKGVQAVTDAPGATVSLPLQKS